jgi:hypothetical protein
VFGLLLLIAISVLILCLVFGRRDQDESDMDLENEVDASENGWDETSTDVVTFEDDYDNPLSALGVEDDSGEFLAFEAEESRPLL